MKKLNLTKEQIAAVEKSIKHWERDIIKPLVNGKYRGRKHYAEQCALCELYCHDIITNCSRCPYVIKYNAVCFKRDELWSNFDRDRTIGNAGRMRNALARIINAPTITVKQAKELYRVPAVTRVAATWHDGQGAVSFR